MIFLLGVADLDIWKHEHAGREIDSGGVVDAADLLEDVAVLAVELLEIISDGVEAIR